MLRQYLDKIEGIEIYPLISLTVFFLFFLAVAWWTIRADLTHLEHMSRMPLNNDTDPNHEPV